MITGPMMATSLASRVDEIAAMGRWPMTAPGAAESYSPPWGPVWPTEGGRTLAGAEGASGETNQIEAQEKQEPEKQPEQPSAATDPPPAKGGRASSKGGWDDEAHESKGGKGKGKKDRALAEFRSKGKETKREWKPVAEAGHRVNIDERELPADPLKMNRERDTL